MTENLLQKLEEKVMLVLTEVEDLRKELHRLKNENASLKIEKENHSKKLQDLLLLLESVNPSDHTSVNTTLSAVKPVLIQEKALG